MLSLDEILTAQKAPAGVPTPDSPTLGAARQGDQVAITWTSAAAFKPQYRSLVNTGDWTDETATVADNGNQHTVMVPVSGAPRFYRLIQK